MSGIDSVQHIVAVIHQEFSVRLGSSSRARPEASGTRQRDAMARGASGTVVERIKSQIAAIDPDDAARERKVFRSFLEAVLVCELGDRLLLDPAFFELVDRVERHMLDSPSLRGHVGAVVKALSQPS
jgi:hypothetical protein